MGDLRERLGVSPHSIEEINEFLTRKGSPVVDDLLEVVERYGGVEEINRRAKEAGSLECLEERLGERSPAYLKDLNWLRDMRDDGVHRARRVPGQGARRRGGLRGVRRVPGRDA